MLGALILDNFKAFGSRQTIPLAPITLIFGANSAGKSSILQSLGLLKQTVNRVDARDLLLLPRGELVDVGSPRDMVFRHETGRVFEIAPLLAVDDSLGAGIADVLEPYILRPERLAGHGFRFGMTDRGVLRLDSIRGYWDDQRRPLFALTPSTAEAQEQAGAVVRVGLAELRDDHVLWETVFAQFRDRLLVPHRDALRRFSAEVNADESVPQIDQTIQVELDRLDSTDAELASQAKQLRSDAQRYREEVQQVVFWQEQLRQLREAVANDVQPDVDAARPAVNAWLRELDARQQDVQGPDQDASLAESALARYRALGSLVRSAIRPQSSARAKTTTLRLVAALDVRVDELRARDERARETHAATILQAQQIDKTRETLRGQLSQIRNSMLQRRDIIERARVIDRRRLDPLRRRSMLDVVRRRERRVANYSREAFLEDTKGHQRIGDIGLAHFLPRLPTYQGPSPTFRIPNSPDEFFLPDPYEPPVPPTPQVLDLAVEFAERLQDELASLVYLGPFRAHPERLYVFAGSVAREVGKAGQFLPDLLFKRPEVTARANEYLKRFNVGYQVAADSIDDADVEDVFRLRLHDMVTGTEVSLVDVGFGVSQVLPVIVQAALPGRRTVLIEQPEIHLHPRLQAELGDLFAECIHDDSGQKQFILETHSEHLILRLQKLIRHGELPASAVSVIFVDKGESGSHARQLRLDGDGEFIDHWPGGFFEEGFEELFS